MRFNYLVYIVIILIGVLTISFVFGADANLLTKTYDEEAQEITFKVGTTEIGKQKLDTPSDNQVGLGYQMVAQITGSPNITLKQFELYDLKDNNKSIDREINIKYLSIGTKSVDDYKLECLNNTLKNKTVETICTNVLSGSHFEDEWLPYSDLEINKEITIGLFTDVKYNDKVEWQPIFDVSGTEIKVNEWATWTGNMSVSLVTVINMDENTGTNVSDIISGNNTVISGGKPPTWTTGKFNKGIKFIGKGSGAQDSYLDGGVKQTNYTNTWTISMWIKMDTLAVATQTLFQHSGTGSPAIYVGYPGGADGKPNLHDGTSSHVANTSLVINSWSNLVFTYSKVTGVGTTWLNGSIIDSYSVSYEQVWDTFMIGRDSGYGFNGTMDNFQVWKRVLTEAEISLLWNSGVGCVYGDETCYVLPSTCTYSSGNWNVNCADNCTITSNVAMSGNNITIAGYGIFTMSGANITGATKRQIWGNDSTHQCLIKCITGCFR